MESELVPQGWEHYPKGKKSHEEIMAERDKQEILLGFRMRLGPILHTELSTKFSREEQQLNERIEHMGESELKSQLRAHGLTVD